MPSTSSAISAGSQTTSSGSAPLTWPTVVLAGGPGRQCLSHHPALAKYQGFWIDTRVMMYFVDQAKLDSILDKGRKIETRGQKGKHIKAKELASLLGLVASLNRSHSLGQTRFGCRSQSWTRFTCSSPTYHR